jgi:CHAT domain-containing protein
VLLDRAVGVDDEGTTAPAHEQRLRLILGAYVSLLARIRGSAVERAAGIDAAAEAFRLAEAARGTSVQRSLDAAAARAAANTPGLADLVRREQDARNQLGALYGLVASALSSTDGHDARSVATLRDHIATLTRARTAIVAQLEREFPAYTQLINPRPLTLHGLRSRLRPDEAVIATYVDDEETFVWAVPASGAVAFSAAPLGRAAVENAAAVLRRSLDPAARTLGDIPVFDVMLAHRLYAALLEPVADGWRDAGSLLIVPHGPLAQLPFALLPTRAVPTPVASTLLFAEYRGVPWLIRSHAITVLPSATALATLRTLPAGDPGRRPFIGFGDPFFSRTHAAEAAAEAATTLAAVEARDRRLSLRASPRTQQLDSSRLGMLPRLPDTAEEIRSIAATLEADLARDVVIGALANEKTVKTVDLAAYRVVAFATHGLVPGDLDGLTQPALALSAPEVADVDGDGLLTMDEILGLRLNADWIVLSACNTASGHGAGSDALSGLGRAFFYAGARTLLVSNWPVETTSARELTTDLFRRQKRNPELTRARALQAAMTALIDGPGFVDRQTDTAIFSYAHPIFWAPFTLVGDGGGSGR